MSQQETVSALPGLVPLPREMRPQAGGGVRVGRLAPRGCPAMAQDAVARLARYRHPAGVPLSLVDDQRLALPEEYRLRLGPDGVELRAGSAGGFHAGVATLEALARRGEVPALEIHDWPAYPHRGLSLDIARSFFGPSVLRQVIDRLAELKLNVLHLHLTDDQGWRIEIPSRPALTDISGGTSSFGGEAGFLTVRQWRDLVAYAAARGVVMVPEFDLPGHTNAALHAYPELTPDGVAPPVYRGDDVGFSQLYPELPATSRFLHDVLGDLAELAPGPLLHIGGDEALAMPTAKYRRVVREAVDIVSRLGKRAVAWQEGAAAGMGDRLTLQYWNTGPATSVDGEAGESAREALGPLLAQAEAGAQVIVSPASRAYLDMKDEPGCPLGQDWAGLIDLETAYSWDPATIVPGLDPSAVVGVEAGLWTEFIHTPDALWRMLLPRLAAIAEVAWAPAGARDYAGFLARV